MEKLDLVNVISAPGWAISSDLELKIGSFSNLRIGNSSYRARLAVKPLPENSLAVPLPIPLPPQMHIAVGTASLKLGPVLAIVVDTHQPGIYPFGNQSTFARELVTRAYTRGVLAYVTTPDDYKNGKLTGYVLSEKGWLHESVPLPDLIYNRYFGHHFKQRDQLIHKLTELEARLVNSPLPDKWRCYLWLKKHPQIASHLPETRLYTSIRDIADLLSRYPEVYLKPRNGFRGQGIVRVSNLKNGYEITTSSGKVLKIADLNHFPPALVTPGRFIVQQGLRLWNYPQFYDLKVLVQNTGTRFVVTGKVARQAEKGRVTTHLHQGGDALLDREYINRLPSSWQERVETEIDQLALEVAAELASRLPRLGEFSLDMGLDTAGRLWIIEVNGKPSRKSFRVAGDLEARAAGYEYLLDYALNDFQNAAFP